jgi:hypothetical protein
MVSIPAMCKKWIEGRSTRATEGNLRVGSRAKVGGEGGIRAESDERSESVEA